MYFHLRIANLINNYQLILILLSSSTCPHIQVKATAGSWLLRTIARKPSSWLVGSLGRRMRRSRWRSTTSYFRNRLRILVPSISCKVLHQVFSSRAFCSLDSPRQRPMHRGSPCSPLVCRMSNSNCKASISNSKWWTANPATNLSGPQAPRSKHSSSPKTTSIDVD